MLKEPFAPGAGEATAPGDTERRDASMTDSGTSPAMDWMEGEGRRDGVGFSVRSVVPFSFPFPLAGFSVSMTGIAGRTQWFAIAFCAPD